MSKNIQYCFKRREKKYVMDKEEALSILNDMKKYVLQDTYAFSEINNIYYDTDNFNIIRTSIEKPIYKEKLRLRSYGTPDDDTSVFVELKKKFNGTVYKRRTVLPYLSAWKRLGKGKKIKQIDQISREVNWFIAKNSLQPKVFIGYKRAAYAGTVDPGLRITFDTEIKWRTDDLDLRSGFYGHKLLHPEFVLMEIKMQGASPIWLAQLLSGHRIFPTSFSKYGVWYKKYMPVISHNLNSEVYSCA